jgi:hypothetical protein
MGAERTAAAATAHQGRGPVTAPARARRASLGWAALYPEVRTVAELDALPELSVVMDRGHDVSQKREGRWCGYESAPLTSTKLAKYGRLYILYVPGITTPKEPR